MKQFNAEFELSNGKTVSGFVYDEGSVNNINERVIPSGGSIVVHERDGKTVCINGAHVVMATYVERKDQTSGNS